MMKKFCVFLVSVLFPVLVMAQDGSVSSDFLSRVADGSARMQYSWKMSADEKDYSGCGMVIFQKGAYRLQSDAFCVYDDGASMWTVNEISREVVGEPSANADIFSNPLSVLNLFGFDSKGARVSFRNGKDGNPLGIDVVLKDGSTARIDISSVSFQEKEAMEFFSFDPDSLDSSYVVTDLR